MAKTLKIQLFNPSCLVSEKVAIICSANNALPEKSKVSISELNTFIRVDLIRMGYGKYASSAMPNKHTIVIYDSNMKQNAIVQEVDEVRIWEEAPTITRQQK